MKNQASRRAGTQSGSAIIIVFIFIALFVAVTFAITKGFSRGGATITSEKARIAASDIVQYATEVSEAVKGLQVSGCRENEISFENNVTKTEIYANSRPVTNVDGNGYSRPPCWVFGASGAGLRYQLPPDDAQVDAKLTGTTFLLRKRYAFAAYNKFYVDDGQSELTMYVMQLKPEVCAQINKILGIGAKSIDPQILFNPEWPWNGEYKPWGYAVNQSTSTDLRGKRMGCLTIPDTSGGLSADMVGPVFYAILINRT